MTPKIPKGWRKLRTGTIIRTGDRYMLLPTFVEDWRTLRIGRHESLLWNRVRDKEKEIVIRRKRKGRAR